MTNQDLRFLLLTMLTLLHHRIINLVLLSNKKNRTYAQPTISSLSKEVAVQENVGTESSDVSYERDPGLRRQIWEYPVNQQDEVRRAYLKYERSMEWVAGVVS